jgi:hypothetical protein
LDTNNPYLSSKGAIEALEDLSLVSFDDDPIKGFDTFGEDPVEASIVFDSFNVTLDLLEPIFFVFKSLKSISCNELLVIFSTMH